MTDLFTSTTTPARGRARHALRRGFTLIEVMGAVAILGIWYVVLATVAMEGLRITGESQRRLDASVLADEILSEIELQAAQGNMLEVSEEERDEPPFIATIQILELGDSESAELPADEAGDLIAFFEEQSASVFTENRDSNWLLTYLREVRIVVSWEEGASELAVHRTAYLFDAASWEEREGAEETTGIPDAAPTL